MSRSKADAPADLATPPNGLPLRWGRIISTLANLPFLSGREFEQLVPGAALDIPALVTDGYIERANTLRGLRYAVTAAGLNAHALETEASPRRLARALELNPERLAAMRWAMPVVADLYALLFTSGQLSAGDISVFVRHRFRHEPVWVHAIYRTTQTEYLIWIDRGDDAIWSWRAAHGYLMRLEWQLHSSKSALPVVLVITTRRQRAIGHLYLAQMQSPKLLFATSGELALLRTCGMDASAARASFLALACVGDAHEIYPADPFTFEASAPSAQSKPRSKRASLARRTPVKPDELALTDTDAQALQSFEALSAQDIRVFDTVCRNPASPGTLLSVLTRQSRGETDSALARLSTAGLITPERLVSPSLEKPHTLYVASAQGAQIFSQRALVGSAWRKRQRFFRADHLMRPLHSFLAARFFVGLAHDCEQRSRAVRALDTPPGALNTGSIPFYALEAHESEFVAADAFFQNAERFLFRPDGYGVVRCGLCVTRFWLEIDGTADAPRGASVTAWVNKLKRHYAYARTRRWALRYETLPRWLIVTANPGAVSQLGAINHAISRELDMPPLDIRYTASGALAQHGALARIWFSAASESTSARGYGFDGAKPVAVSRQKERQHEALA